MRAALKTRLQRRLLGRPRAYAHVHRAFMLLRYLARRPHEADFACFAHFPDRTGLFLDVGANAGTSALSFRMFHRASPILSIEPNRNHETDLKLCKRMIRNFDYMLCAAGEENETLTLHVPVFRGTPLTGEASLRPEGLEESWTLDQVSEPAMPGDIEIQAMTVDVRRLDDLRLEPDFVKIDVEGFEPNVLRGLLETLREHEPIVLIEAAQHVEEVTGLLGGLGYEAFVYRPSDDRLEPHTGAATTNLFFLGHDLAAATVDP